MVEQICKKCNMIIRTVYVPVGKDEEGWIIEHPQEEGHLDSCVDFKKSLRRKK